MQTHQFHILTASKSDIVQLVFIQHFERYWLILDNANLGMKDFGRPGEHPGEGRVWVARVSLEDAESFLVLE